MLVNSSHGFHLLLNTVGMLQRHVFVVFVKQITHIVNLFVFTDGLKLVSKIVILQLLILIYIDEEL